MNFIQFLVLSICSTLLEQSSHPSQVLQLTDHHLILSQIVTILNEITSPFMLPCLRSGLTISLVPVTLVIVRWLSGSEHVKQVSVIVLALEFFVWVFGITFIVVTLRILGSIRCWSAGFKSAVKYKCLKFLIESKSDHEVMQQVKFIQKRERALTEISMQTSTFGKISAMSEIKALEELADYTSSYMLLF